MDEKIKGLCDRCGNSSHNVTTMSMFNKDIICMVCKNTEKNHPKYSLAAIAEGEAVRSGNRNFEGIGLPDDLKVDDRKSRATAMEWWNNKGNKDKYRLQREAGINRNYTSLTGREIEEIYRKIQAQ